MAQHHFEGAWKEVEQGAKQEARRLPDDSFEELELEHHRDLLVSLLQISYMVKEADRQIVEGRVQ